MKKTKRSVERPRGWLYVPIRGVCCLLAKGAFDLRISGRKLLPKKGPLLVLATHQGMMDFLLVFAALKGRRAQFVATQRQFRNPTLRWFYKKMGVIPKVQFRSDPRCVMSILRTLREGGTVVIFPAGQTCMDGTPGTIAPSMARLVKKAGVPVCTLGLRGGFFIAPRYGGLRFGRTEARMEMAFTPERLQELSEDQIYEQLCEKLDFDEYAWQQETGARFKGKALARGYQEVLCYCPKCGGVDTWTTEGDSVRCTACGNTGIVGRDMRLHPAGSEDQIFETLKEWYDWQEKKIIRELEAPDFLLEEPVACKLYDEENQQYRHGGDGWLRLDRQQIRYEGTLDGEQVCLPIEHVALPGLSAEPGVYVELYHEGHGLVRYEPMDDKVIGRMKIAQEYLYSKTLEK